MFFRQQGILLHSGKHLLWGRWRNEAQELRYKQSRGWEKPDRVGVAEEYVYRCGGEEQMSKELWRTSGERCPTWE